ncbi:hypothetical protein V1517DRAFT_132206 [Lipomyces orientalis]|uniref:Uncharacterized protein n=1 Tax=Lipomyces orientalis TaxID=1233043 RepID=A0ACC3TNZ8_9ASCO
MAPPKSGGRPGAANKQSLITQTNKPPAAAANKRKAANKNGHTGPSLLNYFKKLKPGESATNGTTALANGGGGSGLFLLPDDDDVDDDNDGVVYDTVLNQPPQVSEVIEVKSGGPTENVAVGGEDERDSESALPFVLEYEDDENPAGSAGEGVVDDWADTTIKNSCPTEQPAKEIATTETVICPVCASELVDQTEDAIASHVNSCLDQAAADDFVFPEGDNDRHPAAEELVVDDIELAAGDDDDDDDVDYRNDYKDDTGNFDNDSNDDKDISSEDLADTKIKQEPPSPQPRAKDASGTRSSDPQTTQIVRNAISQLLVGSRESQKWTAATTKFQRREQRSSETSLGPIGAGAAMTSQDGDQVRRRCPFYKIMNIAPGVAVDAFRFGAVPNISMYFLT